MAKPVPDRLVLWWSDKLRSILDCPWPGRVILAGDGPMRCQNPARILSLDPGAFEIFSETWGGIEARLKKDLQPISGFGSKLAGAVARLSLGFQLMESVSSETIGPPAMKAACEWAPFLIGHFRGVLGQASERPAKRFARRLSEMLSAKRVPEITERDCFRLLDHIDGMKKMEDFAPVRDELLAANILRPLPEVPRIEGRGQPPSPKFQVNPQLFG
jgi:hypothetical protein